MLIPYIAKYEKVVMGLLAYIDEFKDFENLTEEMDKIQKGARQLYLWRNEDSDNIIGIVGFDKKDEDQTLIIRYLSINPSFRNEGLTVDILSALKDEFPIFSLNGTLETSGIIKNWAQSKDHD
ncbi:reductase [Aerococcus urinaehominis]|uniref:Reductase n=1 Tax=Aerococcus urinaehominis TaxID=128944 RepID=A0A0X8FLV6_9LACT|nr:GNAT family N-acetyltransferase [Aerococcus urinaehominis]AMB99703.1 reductase [Aerococcus urinaehominis]SDL91180.1 riboflavin biosynthesis RibT protein [Aerococcus urinaehominis]